MVSILVAIASNAVRVFSHRFEQSSLMLGYGTENSEHAVDVDGV